jgi:hypothetical protein
MAFEAYRLPKTFRKRAWDTKETTVTDCQFADLGMVDATHVIPSSEYAAAADV